MVLLSIPALLGRLKAKLWFLSSSLEQTFDDQCLAANIGRVFRLRKRRSVTLISPLRHSRFKILVLRLKLYGVFQMIRVQRS